MVVETSELPDYRLVIRTVTEPSYANESLQGFETILVGNKERGDSPMCAFITDF